MSILPRIQARSSVRFGMSKPNLTEEPGNEREQDAQACYQ